MLSNQGLYLPIVRGRIKATISNGKKAQIFLIHVQIFPNEKNKQILMT